MNRQDYIIAKLTDTQVEVRPSVSVQKALKDSMAELAKEVRLAASYGELSDSLQQTGGLVMKFFLALGEEVDETVAARKPGGKRSKRFRRPMMPICQSTMKTSSEWRAVNAHCYTSSSLIVWPRSHWMYMPNLLIHASRWLLHFGQRTCFTHR